MTSEDMTLSCGISGLYFFTIFRLNQENKLQLKVWTIWCSYQSMSITIMIDVTCFFSFYRLVFCFWVKVLNSSVKAVNEKQFRSIVCCISLCLHNSGSKQCRKKCIEPL